MTSTTLPNTGGPLSAQGVPVQWAVLVVLSGGLAFLFEAAKIPAALLIGPMVGGILVAVGGGSIRVPKTPFFGAQGILGCMIAGAISFEILVAFAADWPLFVGVVVSVVAASSLLGWMMSRWQVLPGTTAVWGSSPGAATAMMLMAGAFGADQRLVAFMQYLRVLFVALAASLVARFWVGVSGSAAPGIDWFPAVDWLRLGETLALAWGAAWLGAALRIPAGPLLLPLAIGAGLHVAGLIDFFLPEWLLAASYALIGWNIGLGFNRPILVYAAKALPKIVASIIALLAFCAAIAWLLTKTVGVDPLTAYLATSPGGMDSVAIIAASTKVDLSFVMALQTARFLIVLLAGPSLARLIARQVGVKDGQERPQG